MTHSVPSQSYFFYNGKWSEDMDECFLSSLIADLQCRFYRPELPMQAILFAQVDVQRSFNVELAFNDVLERFTFLKKRYETFTWLVRDKDTAFDITNNIVNARAEVWERLFEQNELAKAYYARGEPQLPKLQLLFGLDDVIKEEASTRSVVNISDTVSPNSNRVPEYVLISDTLSPNPIRFRDPQNIPDDDEVTSPLSSAAPIPRRRLFDEELGTHNVGGPSFPPVHRMPRAPKFDRGESSCASSSPWKWFKP